MQLADATIPVEAGCVTLWRVLGMPGVRYPSKLAAEMAARVRFPNESPDARYARVAYVRYYPEQPL
jgi:hypothetical protein